MPGHSDLEGKVGPHHGSSWVSALVHPAAEPAPEALITPHGGSPRRTSNTDVICYMQNQVAQNSKLCGGEPALQLCHLNVHVCLYAGNVLNTHLLCPKSTAYGQEGSNMVMLPGPKKVCNHVLAHQASHQTPVM